jgi:hypothetical protein
MAPDVGHHWVIRKVAKRPATKMTAGGLRNVRETVE